MYFHLNAQYCAFGRHYALVVTQENHITITAGIDSAQPWRRCYGHSFGILSHYYERESALELPEDVDTILEVEMVISMELMLSIPESQKDAG